MISALEKIFLSQEQTSNPQAKPNIMRIKNGSESTPKTIKLLAAIISQFDGLSLALTVFVNFAKKMSVIASIRQAMILGPL